MIFPEVLVLVAAAIEHHAAFRSEDVCQLAVNVNKVAAVVRSMRGYIIHPGGFLEFGAVGIVKIQDVIHILIKNLYPARKV